jgi:hypothetical protein
MPGTRPSSPGCCSSWPDGWPATLPGSAPPWKSSPETPHATSASCARTWIGSRSCSAPTTASPCSAPTRQSEAMTTASPLRGPKAQKEAASPPLIFRHAAQATGPPLRPQGCSASRCARQPCGLPLTPETTAAPGTRKSGQAQACPRDPRGAQPLRWRATGASRTPGHRELAFDSHKERENYKPREVSRIN